ncbi:MAG: hypothetical protein RML38_11975 [Bacteroidia bacterium]|nr:hypothetical protein [Bacteroidia bacterium]
MRRACVSTVRSEAQHRSESVARSTPTLWAFAALIPTRARPKSYLQFRLYNLLRKASRICFLL